MSGFHTLEDELQARREARLYRHRRVLDSPQGREVQLEGRRLLNFCSNDYLGLASDPRVVDALRAGAARWGAGSGASHLVCGHARAHHDLEQALAEFTGRPRALLFSSAYAANTGVITALLGRGDSIVQDRLNHASLLDGGLQSGARQQRFRHRDRASLYGLLGHRRDLQRRTLIVSDGTFSMDGTYCDVPMLVEAAQRHDAWLMIDDAHSLGVTGPDGRGLVPASHYSTDDVQVLTGALGKAFGMQGGFVAGSDELIEYLLQFARSYIYSTALPPALAAAALTSLTLAQQEGWRREKLQNLIQRFRAGATRRGLRLGESVSPIQPVLLGAESLALDCSEGLEAQGLLVTAIRPPTVPAGTARLRITLTASHDEADVDALLDALDRVVPDASR